MKIQYYSYTRNSDIDYGDFIVPDISKKHLEQIRNRVLAVLSTFEDGDVEFGNPKWILLKNEEIVVWGCCCWNALLSKHHNNTDSLGRAVYGFFAVIITEFDNDQLALPFDINYFSELYAESIAPYWNSSEKPGRKYFDSFPEKFNMVKAKANDFTKLLNTDIFQCCALGNIDYEGTIAAALTCDSISLLINNEKIGQATNRKGPFMNCLSSFVTMGSYSVKQQCPKCMQYVSSFTPIGFCSKCTEDIEKQQENEREVQGKIIPGEIERISDRETCLIQKLEEANAFIFDLQNDLDHLYTRLKKKELLIKRIIQIAVPLIFILLIVAIFI